jgi:hypothetical protein
MTEPVGIGGKAHKVPCAGNPNRPGAVMNDCGKPARWVVIATAMLVAGQGPSVVIIGACDSHLLGVKAWMRDRAEEAAALVGQEFTEDDEPVVDSVNNLGKLEEHFGETAWIASA